MRRSTLNYIKTVAAEDPTCHCCKLKLHLDLPLCPGGKSVNTSTIHTFFMPFIFFFRLWAHAYTTNTHIQSPAHKLIGALCWPRTPMAYSYQRNANETEERKKRAFVAGNSSAHWVRENTTSGLGNKRSCTHTHTHTHTHRRIPSHAPGTDATRTQCAHSHSHTHT